MSAEATLINEEADQSKRIASAALASGQVIQDTDGKAAYVTGLGAVAANDPVIYQRDGIVEVPKTASIVMLKGGKAFWDHSANKAHFKAVNDRDFYMGTVFEDAASADTTVKIRLNEKPAYIVDLATDGYISVLAGTPAAGAFGYPVNLGGAQVLELTATNEAQKVDALSTAGFALTSNAIVEFAFRVLSDGGSGAQDFSIGAASGTHATDFETVAEFVAVHLDGNDTKIYIESDDGTTDVAPTDSTKTYTEGSTLGVRVEVWLDMRDPADVQVYVDGVLVLGSTVFTLGAGAGPLFLIAHLEKTATTDVYKVAVDWLKARLSED
jgi:predicted RecA/RadA family phage recombinase